MCSCIILPDSSPRLQCPIRPGSLEGLMLKLKLQYFGHLMRRVDSLEKTLMLGGIGGRRRRGHRGWDGWMASPTRRMWVWVNSRSWRWTGRPGVLWFMELQRVGLSDWTELKLINDKPSYFSRLAVENRGSENRLEPECLALIKDPNYINFVSPQASYLTLLYTVFHVC